MLDEKMLVLVSTYYALDSKRSNATAKRTLKLFAYAGIRASKNSAHKKAHVLGGLDSCP